MILFLFVCYYIYSKYTWVILLKKVLQLHTLSKKILHEYIRKSNKIWVDTKTILIF